MIMELWVGDSFTLTMIMDWSPTIDKTLLLLIIIVFILVDSQAVSSWI